MSKHSHPSNRVTRVVVAAAIALAVLCGTLMWRAGNRRIHPGTIAGDWMADDLRVDDDPVSLMTFAPDGNLLGADPQFSARWEMVGSAVSVTTWPNDSRSRLHWLRDNSLYGWAIGTNMLPLEAKFNHDRTEMTLGFPNHEPHLRLYRPGHEPKQ